MRSKTLAPSRRQLLLGGAALFGSRFLGAPAHAGVTVPKRFICMCTPNGFLRDVWLPTGSGTSFQLHDCLTPLEPFRENIAVLHNLRGAFDNHEEGMPSTLTESAGKSASLDQVLADAIGRATRLKSIEASALNGDDSTGRISYTGPGVAIPAISSPEILYDRIVGASTTDEASLARTRTQTRAVFDFVRSDFARVLSQIHPSERTLLEAHLLELDDLETRLSDPPDVRACTLPSSAKAWPDPDAPSSFPDLCRLQIENVATAAACDLARVMTLVFGDSGQSLVFDWLDDPVTDDSHTVAHGDCDDAEDKKRRIDTFYAEQFAYLLECLSQIPEADGRTALDHSVVLWANELGVYGDFGSSHSRQEMGVVVAGGANGALAMGQAMDLDGRPYADLLMTLALAMDLELETFGIDGTSVIEEVLA